MIINFLSDEIEIFQSDSVSALKTHLERCCMSTLELEGETRDGHPPTAILLRRNGEQEAHFGIAIYNASGSPPPQISFRSSTGKILIGYDKRVVAIDPLRFNVLFEIELDSPFFSFITFQNTSYVLVIHELGVISLSDDGNCRWKFDTEIISSWRIEDGYIHLQLFDSPPKRLALANGKLI